MWIPLGLPYFEPRGSGGFALSVATLIAAWVLAAALIVDVTVILCRFARSDRQRMRLSVALDLALLAALWIFGRRID